MYSETSQRDDQTSIDPTVNHIGLQPAAVRIAQLERLAAWHRFNASHADSEWVWEARLLAAEQLERTAAKLRRSCSAAAHNAGRADRSLMKHSWFGIAA